MSFITKLIASARPYKRERDESQESFFSATEQNEEGNQSNVISKIDHVLTTCATTVAVVSFIHLSWELYCIHLESVDDSANANNVASDKLLKSICNFFVKFNLIRREDLLSSGNNSYTKSCSENERELRWYERHGLPGGAHGLRRIFGLLHTKHPLMEDEDQSKVNKAKEEKVNMPHKSYNAAHFFTPEGTLASEEIVRQTDEREKEETSNIHTTFDEIETKAKPFALLAELISSWTKSSDTTIIEQRSSSLRPAMTVTNTEETVDNYKNNNYSGKENVNSTIQSLSINKEIQEKESKEHKANNWQLSTFTSNTLLHSTSIDEPPVMSHKSLQNHISYLVHSTHNIRSEDVVHSSVNVNTEQLTRYNTHACLSLFDKVEANESNQWNAENNTKSHVMQNSVSCTNAMNNSAHDNNNYKLSKENDNSKTTSHTHFISEHQNCSCYNTWPDDELHSDENEDNDDYDKLLEEEKQQEREMYKCDTHLGKGMRSEEKNRTPSVRSDFTSFSCLTRTRSLYTNTSTSQTPTNISTNISSQCSNASIQSEEEFVHSNYMCKDAQFKVDNGVAEDAFNLPVCKESNSKKLCTREIITSRTEGLAEEESVRKGLGNNKCNEQEERSYHTLLEESRNKEKNTIESSFHVPSSTLSSSSASVSTSSVTSSSDTSLIKYTNPINYNHDYCKWQHPRCHNDKSKLNVVNKNHTECNKINKTTAHRKMTIAQLWRILETRRELQHLHSEALLHNRLSCPTTTTNQPGHVMMRHRCVDTNNSHKVCLLEDDENVEMKCKGLQDDKNVHKSIKQTEHSNQENILTNSNTIKNEKSDNNLIRSSVASSSTPEYYELSSNFPKHNSQVSVHSPVTFTHNSLPSLSETFLSNFPDPALIAACYRNLHRDYNAYGNVLSDLTPHVVQLEEFGKHEWRPNERVSSNALTEVNGNALHFHSLIEMRNYSESHKVSTPEAKQDSITKLNEIEKSNPLSQNIYYSEAEIETNTNTVRNEEKIKESTELTKEEEENEQIGKEKLQKTIEVMPTPLTVHSSLKHSENVNMPQSSSATTTMAAPALMSSVQTIPFTSALSPDTGHSLSTLSSPLNTNGNVASVTSCASSLAFKEHFSSSLTSYYSSETSSSSSSLSTSCSSSLRTSKLDFTQQLLHERRRDDLRVKNYDGSAQYAISLTYHNSITGASKTIDTNVLPPLSFSGSGPFANASSEKSINSKTNKTSPFTRAHSSMYHHSCPPTWQSPLFLEHQNNNHNNNSASQNNTQNVEKNKYDTIKTARQPCKTLSNFFTPMNKITDKNNIKNNQDKGKLEKLHSKVDKQLPAKSSTTTTTNVNKEEESTKRVPLFSAPLPACEPADGPRLQGVAGRRGEMRIGAFLGGGACGKVYECLNTETGEILAAKQIVFDEKDPQLRQRLKQLELELEVLTISARHQCKWIVGFHGAEKRGHSVLMYLEYCEYSSLLDYLTNGNSHDAPVWGGARSVPADPPPSICLYGETARRIAQERESTLHRLHLREKNNSNNNNDKLYNTVIVQAQGLHESNSFPLIKPLKCLTEEIGNLNNVKDCNSFKNTNNNNNYTTTKIKATGLDTSNNDNNNKANISFTNTNAQDRQHHNYYYSSNNRTANYNCRNNYSNNSLTVPTDGLSTSLMVHLVHSNEVANANGVNGLSCYCSNNVNCDENNTKKVAEMTNQEELQSSTTITNTWDSTLFTSASLPAPFTAYLPESMKTEKLENQNANNNAKSTSIKDEMELSLMGMYNKEQLLEQQRRRGEREQRAQQRHNYKNYLKNTHNKGNKKIPYTLECEQISTTYVTEENKEENINRAIQTNHNQSLNDAKKNFNNEEELEEEKLIKFEDDNSLIDICNSSVPHMNTPIRAPTIATMTLSEALHPQVAPLSIHQVQRFAQQIVNGLFFLHTHGYAHLDVKTANVLVTSNEECRLADLGCAMRLQPTLTPKNSTCTINSSETPQEEKQENENSKDGEEVKPVAHRYRVLLDHDGITELRGTALYMAPEMIRFERLNIGSAADIWSLGCVMMEMATGQAPWRHIATDKLKVLFRVGSARVELPLPPLLRAWNEEAEEWLETHHEMNKCSINIELNNTQEEYEEEVLNEDDDNDDEWERESWRRNCPRRRLENNNLFLLEKEEHDEREYRMEDKEDRIHSCKSSRSNISSDTIIGTATTEKETNSSECNNTCNDVLSSEITQLERKETSHYNSYLELEKESLPELSTNSSNETVSHVSNETAIFYSTTPNHRQTCGNNNETKDNNTINSNSHATLLATTVNNGGGYIPITPGSEEANFNAAHSASYQRCSMESINRQKEEQNCDKSDRKVDECHLVHEHHRQQRSKRQRSHKETNNVIDNNNNRQDSHANTTTAIIDNDRNYLFTMPSEYLSYQHRLMTMYVALTDFIECCLRIAPDERWTIEELAEHPFLHM